MTDERDLKPVEARTIHDNARLPMTQIPREPRSTSDERTKRLLDAAALTASEAPAFILYQHTIFCQTGLPYRDPGDDVLGWERINGRVHLSITAGKAMHPGHGKLVQIGLPFGAKPRLIMAFLNGEALRQQSPEIDVQASLTAFVKRLKLLPGGRTINTIKDQLTRLATAHITLGMILEGRAVTVNSQVVSAFDLWFPKDEKQRVAWPSMLRLSADYFDSLARHAVPLHDAALKALSGNAMALDIYAWLAQRLHRVEPSKPALVPWPALQEQFGWNYDRLTNFRPVFSHTLAMVKTQYQAANVSLDGRGMMLRHSASPVRGRTAIVVRGPYDEP